MEVYGGVFLPFLGCFAALDGITVPSFFKQKSFAIKYTFKNPAVPEGPRKEKYGFPEVNPEGYL